MTIEREPDYLWDSGGEPDVEIVRLETLLGTLRHGAPLAALPSRAPAADAPDGTSWRVRAARGLRVASAAAAALVLLAACGLAWVALIQPRIGWAVESLAGTPRVADEIVQGSARLAVGRWLTTDGRSRARLAAGHIGVVDVEPNTRVQLVESRAREHRMSLAEGTIHARIWAPPKFFFVNTPSAVAIDLGCAYTLEVRPDGAGFLRVTHGWVGFEHAGREAFIPEGAMCATRPGIGPGTPRYEDAPAGFGGALEVLDFGDPDDPRRKAALDAVLADARPRDALTLWHLLQRGAADERLRVHDRMAVLAPPPAGVTRAAVLAGDRRAIDAWWNSLGLDSTTWWRLWKKDW